MSLDQAEMLAVARDLLHHAEQLERWAKQPHADLGYDLVGERRAEARRNARAAFRLIGSTREARS